MSIQETVAGIIDDLSDREGAVIAFSGGVDSAVVAALAHEALGDDAVACTARSETLPDAELADARAVADEIGIRHEEVAFSELDNPDFVTNDGERCYHCRTMRLGKMYETAQQLGIDTVCDGTNASDPGEGHRPGLRAVEELEVFSPLLAHDVTKDEVRDIAKSRGLSVADKPSMACLSSRIPTGLEVTERRLSRVETAEKLLRTWGFSQFRVRDHDGLARIEVAADELEAALDPEFAEAAEHHLTDAGFDHVTLDLGGYATGSVSPANEDASDVDAGTDDDAATTVSDNAATTDDDDSAAADEPPVEDVFDREYPGSIH